MIFTCIIKNPGQIQRNHNKIVVLAANHSAIHSYTSMIKLLLALKATKYRSSPHEVEVVLNLMVLVFECILFDFIELKKYIHFMLKNDRN